MFNKKCDHYWAEAEYLPIDAILDYWCGNNHECREAKKFAIIAACEREEIEYARIDGKDFGDAVLDLIGRGVVVVIHRESFEQWAEKIDARNKPDLPLDVRKERAYLNTIGALLECITGTFKDEKFHSETQLREFIAEKFDDLWGVSIRTTADKFALAKKAINGELD